MLDRLLKNQQIFEGRQQGNVAIIAVMMLSAALLLVHKDQVQRVFKAKIAAGFFKVNVDTNNLLKKALATTNDYIQSGVLQVVDGPITVSFLTQPQDVTAVGVDGFFLNVTGVLGGSEETVRISVGFNEYITAASSGDIADVVRGWASYTSPAPPNGNGETTLMRARFRLPGGAPPPPPATVDLRVNGSDTPGAVASGSNVTVSWTSSGVADCILSPGGETGTSNPGVSKTVTNPPLTHTFSISCDSGAATDSVNINATAGGPSEGCVYEGTLPGGWEEIGNWSGDCVDLPPDGQDIVRIIPGNPMYDAYLTQNRIVRGFGRGPGGGKLILNGYQFTIQPYSAAASQILSDIEFGGPGSDPCSGTIRMGADMIIHEGATMTLRGACGINRQGFTLQVGDGATGGTFIAHPGPTGSLVRPWLSGTDQDTLIFTGAAGDPAIANFEAMRLDNTQLRFEANSRIDKMDHLEINFDRLDGQSKDTWFSTQKPLTGSHVYIDCEGTQVNDTTWTRPQFKSPIYSFYFRDSGADDCPTITMDTDAPPLITPYYAGLGAGVHGEIYGDVGQEVPGQVTSHTTWIGSGAPVSRDCELSSTGDFDNPGNWNNCNVGVTSKAPGVMDNIVIPSSSTAFVMNDTVVRSISHPSTAGRGTLQMNNSAISIATGELSRGVNFTEIGTGRLYLWPNKHWISSDRFYIDGLQISGGNIEHNGGEFRLWNSNIDNLQYDHWIRITNGTVYFDSNTLHNTRIEIFPDSSLQVYQIDDTTFTNDTDYYPPLTPGFIWINCEAGDTINSISSWTRMEGLRFNANMTIPAGSANIAYHKAGGCTSHDFRASQHSSSFHAPPTLYEDDPTGNLDWY